MNTHWLIVDGYCLMHRDPELGPLLARDLLTARQRLIRKIEGVADVLADKTTVVFDGRNPTPGGDPAQTSMEVLYAPVDRTADTVIERLVAGADSPAAILVVTSDRGERETVTAAGARVVSCAQFLDLCREQKSRLAAHPATRPAAKSTLGDYFPRDRR